MLTSGADWISRRLAIWVELVLEFKASIFVVGLVGGALCIYYAAGHLGINTDTADMISSKLPWRQDFIDYRDGFPQRNRNIVIVIDAPTAAQADDVAAALADSLDAEPELFESVFVPGAGPFYERNGLLFLSLDDLDRLAERLTVAQPLLGRLKSDFDGAAIVGVASEAATAASGGDDAGFDPPEAFYGELAAAIDAAAAGVREPLAWQRLLGDAKPGAARRLILLQPAFDFTRIQPAGRAIERLRELIGDLGLDNRAGVTVRLTGTVAMEHEELVSVTEGASRAGIAALVLVAAVLYWAFGSIRLVTIAVVNLLVGLAGTAAFAAAAVGHLNLLSVAFAVLYVGLGVDFILHLGLRLKELVAQGTSFDSAIVESVRGVGASLVICAVTTAAGFYSFIPTPFDGVSELGLISGTGMFISLFVSLTLLPAMFGLFASERSIGGSGASTGSVTSVLLKRPAVVVWVAALVAVATFSMLPRVEFDSNPVHLRDPASESVRTIEDLAASSEAPTLDLFAVADDHRTALEWSSKLEALPVVKDVETADTLVPDRQSEKLEVLEDVDLVLGPGFADLSETRSDPDALARALSDLAGVLGRIERPTEAQAKLEAATERLLGRLAGASAGDAESVLAGLDADLTADLPRQLERLSKALSAEAVGRDDLPAGLVERWFDDSGRELIEITPAENVNDNSAAADFVDAVRAVVPTATGLPVVHHEASKTVVRSFQLAFTYALSMVVLLLLLFLRRLGDVMLVMLPILFAAGVTAGATVWLGIPFNFANIIALPLLVGVGVDNGIHMVHRMRTEPPADGEPLKTSTSRAVLASGLTTVASFGNLAFSAHVGMASMGKLLTLGMVVTLLSTLLLLPAMLKLRRPA